MSEPNPGQDPDGNKDGQDPSKNPPPGDGQDPQPGADPKADDFDKDRALALIEKLRPFEKEATQSKKRLQELESKLKEIEDAKLSDDEKKTKRLQELEEKEKTWQSERRQLQLEQAVERAASKLNAEYPDLVMLKVKASEIEYGEDGRPTKESVEAQIEQIRVDYPALFKSETKDTKPPSSGGGTNAGKQTALTWESVQAMTREERKARQPEIDLALAEGRLKRKR